MSKKYYCFGCVCAAAILLASCTAKEKTNEDQATADETVEVTVEDHSTTEETLAETPAQDQNPLIDTEVVMIYELTVQDQNDEQKQKAMYLVNRIMSMLNATENNTNKVWLWYDAVNVAMRDYAQETGRSADPESVIRDIDEVMFPLSGGAQFEMNQYAYVDATIQQYIMIGLYHSLVNGTKNNELKTLIREEFDTWCAWSDVLHQKYSEIDLGEEWYSMKPLEISSNFRTLCCVRAELLKEELSVLSGKTDYEQRMSTVTSSAWQKFLSECNQLEPEMKYAFNQWRDRRVKIQKLLGGDAGKAYDRITADIHAILMLPDE